jgi:hypothetical protein
MSTRIVMLEVPDTVDNFVWDMISAELKSMGATIEVGPGATCAACERLVVESSLRACTWAPRNARLCQLCFVTAAKIRLAFEDAAARHWRTVQGQLLQAIRDVRGGADIPTFYHTDP